jgi:hypothetical protein
MAMLRVCFGLVVVNTLVLPTMVRAQDVGAAPCQGVVCDLVPGSGTRPVTESDVQAIRTAEDARARKVAADFDNQRPDAETRGVHQGWRHAGTAMHRGAKVAKRTTAGKTTMRTGLSSYEPARPSAAAEPVSRVEKPLATIFGLAPLDVDPYAAGLKPWVGRLSWPETAALASGATVFALDGYRDPSLAPVQTASTEPAATAQAERDSLDRRAAALSIQGFGTLKADLPRS